MDYCAACRRHINGALSCPGCGTPAHQLGAQGPADAPAQASATDGENAAAESGRAERRKGAGRGPAEGAPRRSGSRARTRRVRNRRRSRLVVGTLVGAAIVLVGWSVAELPLAGYVTGANSAAADHTQTDGASPSATSSPGGKTSGDPKAPDSDASASASASTSASPSVSESAKKSPSPKVSVSATASHSSAGSGSTAPAGGAPTASAPPQSAPASQPATHTPKPTPSCTRFLWWCT
ncbi:MULTISPECIES: hypothetical protein [unclassified Streptomyces]|uniref:SCO2400 family protein n=1 Tax=unclassified Streptomyces TaxID=2593676 RepID=UPI00131A3B92|nr:MULTISPECIES: hypothetical protein [unclassified Streptomyces]MYX32144.1 hypothetical protein [Streptomyces sp. SID8377]